jgi:hypothetical protein
MYQPGLIFYFTPFYFKDGKTAPKNKYFIVLCNEDDNLIVASLPSSQDYVPAFAKKEHGCIDVPEGCFNCYYFLPDKVVTTNSWAFPKPTYIYANWIDSYSNSMFGHVYKKEGHDYEVIGRLTKDEYEAVIKCFLIATNTKRKVKRLLQKAQY